MQCSVKGRVALVTGAGRGAGRAIALALAEAGADIAVNYRREHEAAAEVVAAIEKLGRRAKAYAAAVDDFEASAAMVSRATDELGPIGILVNNAGIASRGHSVLDTDGAELERVIRVHALAPHFLAKQVLPAMRKLGRGDIVMISSTTSDEFNPNTAPYTMGKVAAEALAKILAKEERKYGIRTNIVAPTLIATDMGDRLAKATVGATIEELNAKFPFGHVLTPAEVASAVLYLVSDQNLYANGVRLVLDGGGDIGVAMHKSEGA